MPHQRRCGEDEVDARQDESSGGVGERELDPEQREQCPGGPAGEPQCEQDGDAHHGLGCGKQHFLGLPAVKDQGGPAAAGQVGQG